MLELKNSTVDNVSSASYIDDLINSAPNWLVRSGITILAIVTLVLIILSATIKYPDKILTKGIITSDFPPIEHVNPTSGIIEEIYIKDDTKVDENDSLIYIKNNLNRNDLNILKAFIERFSKTEKINNFLHLQFPNNLQLGEIQDSYNDLQMNFSQLQLMLKKTGHYHEVGKLTNELTNTKELRNLMLLEKNILKEELVLNEKDFNRNILLNDEKVVSDIDKEKAESNYLRSKAQLGKLDQSILQNRITEDQLILEKHKIVEEQKISIQDKIIETLNIINIIKSLIMEWDKKYIIRAEISGEISLNSNIAMNKYIEQDMVLLSIIPIKGYSQKFIKVKTSSIGLGKISLNDKVIIKLDGYPYKEYGVLTAYIKNISTLPEIIKTEKGENQYLYTINIDLPDTLITNYRKVIKYHPNSTIHAEIITKDKTILERLFDTIFSLLKRD